MEEWRRRRRGRTRKRIRNNMKNLDKETRLPAYLLH